MKYLRTYETYESIPDIVKPYLNKYVVIPGIVYKNEKDSNYYLLKVKKMYSLSDDVEFLMCDKLYTLYPDEIIKKNKKHSIYSININDIKNIIYYSDKLIDAYQVLCSVYDTKRYNM